MRSVFQRLFSVFIGVVVFSAPVSAQESKVLSQELGLSIVCLSEPFEAGWDVVDQFSNYTLLKYDGVETSNPPFRLTIENFPCFYEVLAQNVGGLFHVFSASHPGPMVEIDGHLYPAYASEDVMRSIVRQLRTRCAPKWSVAKRLPSVLMNTKQSPESYCARQVQNVLTFHSVYLDFDPHKLSLGDGLHFILGRPYIGGQEIKLW